MLGNDTDDPLAHTTARLSISQVGNDGVDANETRRQFLQAYGSLNNGRRESVISFEESEQIASTSSTAPGPPNSTSGDFLQVQKPSKRRRSSAQSITSVKKEKLHKKKLKKLNERPAFQISAPGKKGTPLRNISIPTLRDLVLYVLTPHSNASPKWVDIVKKEEINKVVVVFVPGLEMADFNLPDSAVNVPDTPYVNLKPIVEEGTLSDGAQEKLGFFYDNFDTLLKTIAPGSKDSIYSPFHAFTHHAYTPKEKKKMIDDSKSKKLTLPDLLLSKEDMIKYGYPMPASNIPSPAAAEAAEAAEAAAEADTEESAEKTFNFVIDSDGYFTTRKFDHEGSHTFALDCEFCKAESGKVLTRISIVNFQGEVVLDKYVQPAEEIIDYVTKYSGITPEKLEGVTTTISDIQAEFLSIVSDDDILIGHSLESDLNVLKIKHSKIIDTALVYEHPRGPPAKPSLKWLADKHLARTIQQGESDDSGHSSVEDAEACLDLIKMKLIEGSCFGVNMSEMSIYERLNKSVGAPVSSLVVDYTVGNGGMDCLSPDEEKYNLVKRKGYNDDQIIQIFEDEIKKDYSLMILKLRELEFSREWCTPPASFQPEQNDNTNLDGIQKLNLRLQKIYSSLPPNTGLVVTSSQGNPREMIRLQGVRREFQNSERAGETPSVKWDFDEASKLQEATVKARGAVSFICVSKVNEYVNGSGSSHNSE